MLLSIIALLSSGWNCQSAYADKWVQTNPSDLKSNDVVAIVDVASGLAMANSNGTGAAPAATAVTLNSDLSEITSEVAAALQWVVTVENNSYKFGVAGTENFLYCTNSNNGVRVGTNANNSFAIQQADANNTEDYLFNTATSRYLGVYNGQDWRCYTTVNNNIKNTLTKLYKKTSDAGDTRVETQITLGDHETAGQPGTTLPLPTATVTAGETTLSDADITWTSSNEEVATIDASTGIISLVNAGTTTVKATFAGNNSYKSSEASYTLTVSLAYTSLKELQETVSNTSTPMQITFNNVVVNAVKGSNAWISDADGYGALVYTNNHGLQAGNVLNGTIQANYMLYRGQTEITNFTTEGLTITTTELVPQVKTIDALTTANQSMLVTLKGLTYNAADKTLSDGTNTITYYDNFNLNVNLEEGKTYDITGIVILFNTTLEISPRTADDIVATSSETQEWTFRDFGIDMVNVLTKEQQVDGTSYEFGVVVGEDGSLTQVAADAAHANIILKGKYHNNHGWTGTTATVKVNGPVQIDLGNCYYGSGVATVKDAAGNQVATATLVKDKTCWGQDNTSIVSMKYTGEATTLTIEYGSYLPYIGVKAIEASAVSVSYTTEGVDCEGDILPEGGQYAAGDAYTIPAQNYTLFKEGYTLTAWTDGTNEYAAGSSITLPASDITLKPVFSQNEVNLADRTEAVTLKWNLRRDQGAPTLKYEGKTGFLVAQATVNGKTIDVKMPFNTSPGKLNNANNTDWAQCNQGTTFTLPSCKGAIVSLEAYNAFGADGKVATTIDGQSDYTSAKTITYTTAASAETVDVVIGNDAGYLRYLQVVLPVVESQGGTTYKDEEATVVWPFSDPDNISAHTATPEGVFSTISTSIGDLTIGKSDGTAKTGTCNVDPGYTFVQLWNNGGNDNVEWAVKPAAGLSFTPTKITGHIVRFGTDKENGIVITAKKADGESIALGTFTAPRNNNTKEQDKFGANENYTTQFVIELTADQQQALSSAEGFSISSPIGVGYNKSGGFADVTITGLINGTAAAVEKFTLTATAAPAEGGSVSVYPAADEYEAGSEVTLTATENFGYDFVNWTDADGKEVSADTKFKYTVESNTTLTANFKQVNTYELNLSVEGSNDYMVTLSPAPTVIDGKNMYEEGQTVVLTANQYEGLVTFNNWNDGDTKSEKTVTMTKNVTLTATYAQADIIAGWDFYLAGNNGRKADFASQDNEAAALSLVNTETGETSGWLDKSTIADGGYEGFKGAAVNWREGTQNGDVGHWHWQTKINAEAYTDINIQFQMLYNYNAYQTYQVEYSLNGTDWTNVGSISMEGAKNAASFNSTLPAAANNHKELYIRMIADKSSSIDGTASPKDGNALAMFFITGTAKLVDDGQAPKLVSTVPVEGATGVSANGKIVLTFDERVKLTDEAVAYVNNTYIKSNTQNPTKGIVNGKTITFEYKGLEYATLHNFVLAAKTVADLTDNFITEPINLSFTTMERPSVTKGIYDAVVENVDQLVAAFKAADERSDKNVRYRIFLKKGTYQLPQGTGDVTYNLELANGSTTSVTKKDPITRIVSGNISLIGESRDEVIITNTIPADETFEGKYGTASVYEGISKSDVLQTKGENLYYQDLTVSTGMDDARGRDIAVEDMGKHTIYKNVCLHGYQDTWVGQNDDGLYYFEGGVVRGRTDYMCGKGDAYFNGVELRQIAGGYAAVPSKPANIGWVYKDCVINADGSGVDGKYTLGRPWGKGTPVALFIDTKMNVVPSAIGWNEMNDGWPARFAEYNSTTSTGSEIDLSGRKKIFAETHENNPVLSAEEAAAYSDMSKMFGDWNPTLYTEQAPVPTNVKLEGTTLTWDNSNYVFCWAICKDGNVVDFTTEPNYTVSGEGTWSVRAANEMGGLSEATEANSSTGIESIDKHATNDDAIYNMQGIRVSKATKGVYIVGGRKIVKK